MAFPKPGSNQAPWSLPSGTAFQVLVFLAAFVIILSRRPDAVLNAQFYAEDGMVWYPQAYQFGLHSFLLPVAGYLHALIRVVALLTLLFPFSLAPLVMNLSAITIQILPANIFLSSRFSNIPSDTRLVGSLLYLAMPNSWEVNANITNVQWHLALLACMLLLAQPAIDNRWRIFDAVVLVLISFSSPLGILLVPIAAALWWKRRQRWSAFSLALLVPGALVEALLALLSHSRQVAPNGATFFRLIMILGGQVFFSALLGWQMLRSLASGLVITEVVATIATAVGLLLVLYVLRYAPLELKLFIVFCFAVLALGLARPLAGPPDHPQWEYLCIPGRGNRYYFLASLGFLACLLWLANRKASRTLRYFAVALLCLLPIGILADWTYPPFKDYHFRKYAEVFHYVAPGTTVSIPINPGMMMQITKH
jgi:hypothetical protein